MPTWTTPILALAATATLALSQTAEARQLRYAIGFPPGAIPVLTAQQMAEVVKAESNDELRLRIFPMSLLNMAETSPGLRDGMADVGLVLTPYHPAEYPHTNLISEASMVLRLMGDQVKGREGIIYVPAMAEFIFQKCPECLQEFGRQNQVFGGIVGGSSYGLLCNQPVRSLEDMRGKRFRAGAANWSRWVVTLGGTPVTMTGNEMLESLKQGVVDCVAVSAPEVPNFGLAEAINDVTMDVPGGLFTTAGQNINQRTWRSLTPEQRTAFLKGAAVASAQVPWRYHQAENEVLDDLRARGATLHDASPELVAATQQFIETDMDTMARDFAQRYGVQRGPEMLAEFRVLLDKWDGLTTNVTSPEELAALYWEEIYSKIDPTQYGM